jgi:predicted small integral membrane protein
MAEYKTILGSLSVVIGFIAYAIYLNGIFKNRIKPHVFSWLIWGIVVAIAFAAQVVKGAGAGSWNSGVTALMCFLIVGLTYARGKRDFSIYDWASLLGALAAVLLWVLVKEPTGSVVILCVVNLFGTMPTLCKSYKYPQEESAVAFSLNGFKFVVAILALQSYSIATWLFPLTVSVGNAAIISVLLMRRKQLNLQKTGRQ